MKESLSTQDLILISSYLDGKLSANLKAKVEVRASKDTHFKSTIEDLAYARKLLRSLPQRRAPRNFTLSQKYAPAPRRLLFQPVFAFTSVIATVITVVILAGSLFFPMLSNAKTASPAMPEAASLASGTSQDSSRSSAEQTPVPPLILWNGVPYGSGGYGIGGGGGGDATGMGGAGGSGQPIGGGAEQPAPGPTPTPTMVPMTTFSQPAANPNDLILGIAPKAAQGQEITPQANLTYTKSPQAQPSPRLSTANILEIVFGAVALIAAALALLLRRRA